MSFRFALSALLVACGPPTAASTTPDGDAEDVVVDVTTGQPVSFERLAERLAEARVVYVGERHDRREDHAAQRALLAAVHARHPDLALGFEMFQRPFQPHLDAYVAGEIDLPTLLERTEWADRWGFDAQMYAPLLEYARAHRLPLVALNASQETTRTVARQGLDALDEATRGGLPELDREQAAHRERVLAALAHHPGMSEDTLERFYTAQLIWDETMARSVAEALENHPGRSMIVFAGGMHVARDAIPLRAARRGAGPFQIVLPADERSDDDAVDYLWLVRAAPAE